MITKRKLRKENEQLRMELLKQRAENRRLQRVVEHRRKAIEYLRNRVGA